jgi:phage shock protein PspC (stress-responsive transcriptional regulator)
MEYLARFILVLSQVLSFAVLAHVILSYFMDPAHPIRRIVDSVVVPL